MPKLSPTSCLKFRGAQLSEVNTVNFSESYQLSFGAKYYSKEWNSLYFKSFWNCSNFINPEYSSSNVNWKFQDKLLKISFSGKSGILFCLLMKILSDGNICAFRKFQKLILILIPCSDFKCIPELTKCLLQILGRQISWFTNISCNTWTIASFFRAELSCHLHLLQVKLEIMRRTKFLSIKFFIWRNWQRLSQTKRYVPEASSSKNESILENSLE